MTLSPFPTFLTFLTFGFGSCRLAAVRDHEDSRPGCRSTRCFFPGHLRQKGQKGGVVMMLGTFLIFLTFLARKLCLPAVGSAPWQGLPSPRARPAAGLRSRWRRPGRFRLTVLYTETEVTRSTSRRFPNRLEHELIDFEHGGIRYTAGVGRFEDGTLAEIFLNTAKQGTAVDVNARDAAVAASLLLQHGCPVDILRQALTRNSDGSGSGPLACALDLIAEWR